ncbi:hypothetical protein ACHAWF_008484 [Thalassiosira exigua]
MTTPTISYNTVDRCRWISHDWHPCVGTSRKGARAAMRAAGSAGPRVGPSGGGRDGGSGTTPRSNVAPTPTSPQNRTEDIAVLDRRAVPSRPSPSTGLFLAATGVERESDDDDVAQRFRSTGRRDFGEEGRPASGPGRRNWGSSLHGDVRELRSSCGAGDTGEDCPKDRAGANGRQRGQRDSRKISRRRSSWLVAADARGERKRKKTRTGKTTEGEGIATTMINYFKGAYNVNLLPRVHGSALYKGSIVGLLSVLIYLAIVLRWNERERNDGDDLDHPYGVGVLVTSVSFLIIFRANHSYQRYWEAVVSFRFFSSPRVRGGVRGERGGGATSSPEVRAEARARGKADVGLERMGDERSMGQPRPRGLRPVGSARRRWMDADLRASTRLGTRKHSAGARRKRPRRRPASRDPRTPGSRREGTRMSPRPAVRGPWAHSRRNPCLRCRCRTSLGCVELLAGNATIWKGRLWVVFAGAGLSPRTQQIEDVVGGTRQIAIGTHCHYAQPLALFWPNIGSRNLRLEGLARYMHEHRSVVTLELSALISARCWI